MVTRPKIAGLFPSRAVRNALIDLKYGRLLSVDLKNWHSGKLIDLDNSDYLALGLVFENVIKENDVLVDVGCRKGRVINWWLHSGHQNRMIGIEIDEEIAGQTRHRFRKYPNVTIVAGDILSNVPPNGTLFYLFNSLDPVTLEGFKNKLLEVVENKANLIVIYYNCEHLRVFQDDPNWVISTREFENSGLPFQRVAIIKPTLPSDKETPSSATSAFTRPDAGC